MLHSLPRHKLSVNLKCSFSEKHQRCLFHELNTIRGWQMSWLLKFHETEVIKIAENMTNRGFRVYMWLRVEIGFSVICIAEFTNLYRGVYVVELFWSIPYWFGSNLEFEECLWTNYVIVYKISAAKFEQMRKIAKIRALKPVAKNWTMLYQPTEKLMERK